MFAGKMDDIEQDEKMNSYMIFRAVTPPSFDVRQYNKYSGEPIRYDPVTAVEADSPENAVNAVIAATGTVSLSFAAVECTIVSFTSKSKLSADGVLRAPGTEKAQQLESNDAKLERLQREIDQIQELSND